MQKMTPRDLINYLRKDRDRWKEIAERRGRERDEARAERNSALAALEKNRKWLVTGRTS